MKKITGVKDIIWGMVIVAAVLYLIIAVLVFITHRNNSNTESADAEISADTSEDWVQEHFKVSMQKLADKGVLSFSGEDGFSVEFNNLLVPEDDDILYQISMFNSYDVAKQYAEKPDLSEGKLIFAFASNWDYVNIYYDYDHDIYTETPYYRPDSYGDYLTDRTPDDRWADSLEECDYLLLTLSLECWREEEFYIGNHDRVTTATVNVVIDTESEEIIYAETIYVDTPGYTTDHMTGYCNDSLAAQRFAALLSDEHITPGESCIAEILNECTNPRAYGVCDMNGDNMDEVLVMSEVDGELEWIVFARYAEGDYDSKDDNIDATLEDSLSWEWFCGKIYVHATDASGSGPVFYYNGKDVHKYTSGEAAANSIDLIWCE